ncbi:MAG: uroporphyrinogen decarboxylase family protein, partial [Candidatus Bathyarchaeia archaeon]
MNSVDRVYTAIRIEEPDRLPKGELEIHKELIQQLLKTNHQIGFEEELSVRKMLNMDLVVQSCDETSPYVNCFGGHANPKIIGETPSGYNLYRDVFGNEVAYNGKTIKVIKRAIQNPKEIYSYEFPSPSNYGINILKKWIKNSGMFVFSFVGGGFDNSVELIGLKTFLVAVYTNNQAVKELVRRVTEFNTECAKRYIEAGAHGIFVGDDLAYNKGTFLPPEKLRELIFPYIKKEVAEIKKYNIPVMLHSDGNINVILDDIVDMDFDGLQSLQPSANMKIEEIKQKYGHRLCLMGNIDLDWLLPHGTKEDVRREVKKVIRVAAPGGGYILSSTNVLTKNIPTENVIEM